MSRYRATCYQLLISASVLSALAYVVLVHWYPGFFARIDGAWQGLRLIAGIELILGPLLTLFLFKPGKPGLKFDLAVTGVLRVLCITAGAWIVYTERPLFFIYYDAAFYSADADTYLQYDQPAPEQRDFGSGSPVFVVAAVPDNPIEEAGFRKVLYDDGLPIWVYARSYAPLDAYLPMVLSNALPAEKLQALVPDVTRQAWIEEYGGSMADYAFFPVHARYLSTVVGLHRQDGSLVGVMERQ